MLEAKSMNFRWKVNEPIYCSWLVSGKAWLTDLGSKHFSYDQPVIFLRIEYLEVHYFLLRYMHNLKDVELAISDKYSDNIRNSFDAANNCVTLLIMLQWCVFKKWSGELDSNQDVMWFLSLHLLSVNFSK